MPKDSKPNDKNNKKKPRKNRKDIGKPGSKAEEAKIKAEKSKRKKVKVYLPVVIKQENGDEKVEVTEAEISYFDKLLCTQVERLAAKGLNNDQIIKEIGISRDNFYKRIREDAYFSYALFKHRHLASHEVENALFKSAVGFEYKEEHGTPTGMINELTKYALPNVKAQEFWLTNMRKNEWKKKIEAEQQIPVDMGQITFIIKRREE